MFDFHSAFLNNQLDADEDIYMEQPPHHTAADPDRYIVKLHKSIYSLKQAGRRWYDSLSHSLADIGLQKSEADPAIFYVHIGSEVVILAIHVDDCTITGSSVFFFFFSDQIYCATGTVPKLHITATRSKK